MERHNKPLSVDIYIITGLLYSLLLFASINSSSANPHFYDLPILRVTITGNETTQNRFILKWANLQPGELLTRNGLKLARQNILDTSLFKQVIMTTTHEGDGVAINIDLEEKYYTLLLPRLGRNSNGDIKYGLKLRMHNIGGADQTLNIQAGKTDHSDGDKSRRYHIDYDLPQFSKPYYYQWHIGQSTINTYQDGFDNIENSQYTLFSIARDMHTRLFQQPVTLRVWLKFEDVSLDQPYPEEFNAIEAGSFSLLGVAFEYDGIHHQRYRRYGQYYSMSYQQGLTELGSDFVSQIAEFESRILRPLNSRDNLNYRLFIGFSEASPFNSNYYHLGGADNVRGLERDIYSGNALVFGNFEYVTGYTKYPNFRTSIFFDIGNVFDDASSIDFGDLYAAIGLGMRWKLTSFIKTDLVIDVAYDPDNEEIKGYAGTHLNF